MIRFLAFLLLLAAVPAAAAAPLADRADGVEFRTPALTLRVTALTNDILRIRIARGTRFDEDASWAVAAEVRARHIAVAPTADGFATATLRVRLAGGRLTVEDKAGKVISADAVDPVKLDGGAFTLRKQLPLSTHIFGLGDKTGGLDRRGKSFVDWNTDAYGFSSADDPIYKSIPFFVAVGGEGGSYGLFLDNSRRTWFDVGHKEEDVIALGGPDGPVDYYLIAGPSTAEVVRRYTDLTGKAPLTPLWALGYQQSRYSYMTADELRQIAARLRSDRVPTDVLWMDIAYQDRNRPFTVDAKAFPDMKGLVADLGRQGFRAITITDLHVARLPGQGYAPYDSGAAIDAFVHNPNGSVYVAPVWPGPSVFPDFTDAKIRTWWGGLFRRQVEDGIAGAWNDMNEPAIFETPSKTMPLDVVHRIASDDFAPRTASHAEIHNVYGMENTRATYDGLRRLAPNERAFVMTRASYAGGQRYAVTWTGDNSATWDHLKLSVQQLINLGLSGFSYSGADVSGFAGGPSPDLLTRWFEIGAFYPIFRDHSATGTPRVEPWVDGPEHLAIRRRFVEERYKLMPYLYALADENARAGDPILRPVFYDHPAALQMGCDQSFAFTLGRDLLIAPPPHPESPAKYDICLPPGGWYDYWTGLLESDAAAKTISATPALDRLPVYVRAGTILPRQPLVQSTAETPKGPLTLDIYPGPDCRGTIYLDDGHSMAFEKGAYLRQTVRCRVTEAGLELDFGRREGSYRPWWREIAATVHGRTAAGQATTGGREVAVRYDSQSHTETFALPDMAEGHVTIH
jgi:alpha-glucosidase